MRHRVAATAATARAAARAAVCVGSAASWRPSWSRYRVAAWPTIVLIDRRGRVRNSFVGDDTAPAIDRVLKTLLAEK